MDLNELKAARLAAVKAGMDIVRNAKAAARPLEDDERETLEAKQAEVEDLTKKIERAEKDAGLMAGFESAQAPDEGGDGSEPAASLGDHFAKHMSRDDLVRLKTVRNTTIALPEYGVKANTDPNTTPGVFDTPVLTQVDRTIVRDYRRPSVVDLFGSGTIGAGTNAITYFVEGSVEGNFATVGEAGQKPQLHFTDPTSVTDSAKKIAAWWDTSDEMMEDVDFWVSEVNNRGLYALSLIEESQVLSGDGLGNNLTGVLARSGIQTETAVTDSSDNADALFRAAMKVQTATGLPADGIVINPADYQTLRLSVDGNGQYFGGGFFQGPYGQGGVPWQPPLWGLRTILSAAVSAGSAVVGAFRPAATLYRKGGVRIESTNSDAAKFTSDIVTTRIEERLLLAVRIPAAIVDVTLL